MMTFNYIASFFLIVLGFYTIITKYIANTEKYLQSAIFFFRFHAVFTGNARLYIVTPY